MESESNQEIIAKIFDAKSKVLIQKLDLEGVVPNFDKVMQRSLGLLTEYDTSIDFFDDDINLLLILGCGQKLVESEDLMYQKRIHGLVKRLLTPRIDDNSSKDERTGLSKDDIDDYVSGNKDVEETERFIDEHSSELERIVDAWKSNGFDLEVEVVIADVKTRDFKRKTGSSGMIWVPSKSELIGTDNATIQIYLPKEFARLKKEFVAHELYHMSDYWNYVRRGQNSEIFENLDELHTEFMVGNFKDEPDDPTNFKIPGYSGLKTFWNRLSFIYDLDFTLLEDRENAIKTITREFGFEGIVDFALLNVHSSGSYSTFETFYQSYSNERPILDMMIAREKMNLRRAINDNSNLDEFVSSAIDGVNRLSQYSSPKLEFRPANNRSIYDIIPSKYDNVYGSDGVIDNEEARSVAIGFAKAIAFSEVVYSGQLDASRGSNEIVNALSNVPKNRSKIDFNIWMHAEAEMERYNSADKTPETIQVEVVNRFYHGLFHDMPGIDFVFGLNNPIVRNQFLEPFIGEIDKLAQYCLDTDNIHILEAFVSGFYAYNLPFELRDYSIDHLSEKYPELKPIIDNRKTKFKAKELYNLY